MLVDLKFDRKIYEECKGDHIEIIDFDTTNGIRLHNKYTFRDGSTDEGVLEYRRLADGVYIGELNLNNLLELVTEYDEGDWSEGEYGVADNLEQILAHGRSIVESPKEFILSITPMKKSEQPSEGGWRWHKWGEYIGTQTPTTEYLFDEPLVEEVWVFHFYPIVKK